MWGKLYELVDNQIIFAEDEVIIMELAITEADVVEVVLPAAPTAEEKEENRVLASALGNNDGDVAEEEMETGTEAALPTPASAAAIGEDMPGPAMATETRKKRGKGC